MTRMRIIEADEARAAFSMPECIKRMRAALIGLNTGENTQPLRTMIRLPGGNALGFMPAVLGREGYFGAKLATAFMSNIGTQYPSHMGYVMLMESAHGQTVAMVDATFVTQMRTGAVSAVATDLLARKDARTLALIGAGAQARSHLAAIKVVRDISQVRVFDALPGKAAAFASDYDNAVACDSVRAACAGADIVCTLTTCKTPVLSLSDVAPGAHVNAVGAYTKTTREIASDLVAASLLYADDRSAILSEGGEFLLCKADGFIDESHILGDLGELLTGKAEGRKNDGDITLFSAHGLAVEDVACALQIYQSV